MRKRVNALMMTAAVAVFSLVSISTAQIGIIWSAESYCFAYLGSANMDDDPVDELVYFNPAPDQIIIYDGQSGNIDWDSGEWYYIGIAGHIGSDGQLRGYSPFCDINNDGVKEITFRGQQFFSSPFTIYVVGWGGTGISSGGGYTPSDIHILSQNYPNPFNPTTAIQYSLTSPGDVTIKIYSSLGQEVRTIVSEFKSAGEYTVNWDGKDQQGNFVSSGTYFYQMQVGDFTSAKKAIVLK